MQKQQKKKGRIAHRLDAAVGQDFGSRMLVGLVLHLFQVALPLASTKGIERVRQLLDLPHDEPGPRPGGLDRRWYLGHLALWPLCELEEKLHDTPLRKGIKAAAQGAIRWVQYEGEYDDGVLRAACIQSVKWKKKQKQVCGEKSTVDAPYILECAFKHGKPASLSCGCPVQ